LLAADHTLSLTWKEFDGENTTVPVMMSKDDGRTWSEPKIIAPTRDVSDHPLLVSNGSQIFLSWQTRAGGYRLLPLETSE
jgi:hypothetical protein